MILCRPRSLFALAALAWSSLSFAAERVSCGRAVWPEKSLQRNEDGMTVLALQVRTDGTVGRTVVLVSSGSTDLDEAAQEAMSQCVYKPATVDGKPPVEFWTPVVYTWTYDTDPKHKQLAKRLLATASKGDVYAQFYISMIMKETAKTPEERKTAEALALATAQQGYAQAQWYEGNKYDQGKSVPANREEALRWYRKAAAQGHVIAIDRLRQLESSPPADPALTP